jgi:hypothetical protein
VALTVRLDPTCDVRGAVPQPSDRAAAQRYERAGSGSAVGATTWYTVLPGGCITTRFAPKGDAGSAVLDEANSVVDLVSRAQLDRTLSARSQGRLQLDP